MVHSHALDSGSGFEQPRGRLHEGHFQPTISLLVPTLPVEMQDREQDPLGKSEREEGIVMMKSEGVELANQGS